RRGLSKVVLFLGEHCLCAPFEVSDRGLVRIPSRILAAPRSGPAHRSARVFRGCWVDLAGRSRQLPRAARRGRPAGWTEKLRRQKVAYMAVTLARPRCRERCRAGGGPRLRRARPNDAGPEGRKFVRQGLQAMPTELL